MKLKEAQENIGAEIVLDESTKPYTWIDVDGEIFRHDNTSNTDKMTGTLKIISVDIDSNVVVKGDNDYQECYLPHHIKFKTKNDGCLSWEDALRAIADGKKIQLYSVDRWVELDQHKVFSLYNFKQGRYRILPKQISLNGDFTEEELLKKIEELRNM